MRFREILFMASVLAFLSNVGTALALDVHGHRGARARYPENTLPAFQYALQRGVDYLEMDMAVTKDNHIVISHDPHILKMICLEPGGKRIVNEPLIHDLTLEQVKQYDCGSLRNPKFKTQTPVPGTRIPTLDEVFEMVRTSPLPNARRIQFNIETKIFPAHPEYTVDPETFMDLVLESFRRSGFMDRIILQSFDYRTLRIARRREPTLRISALTESFSENLEQTARTLKPDNISPHWKRLSKPWWFLLPQSYRHTFVKERVSAFHRMGVKLVPWTVNDPRVWADLIDAGVDAIITDDPARLLNYLHRPQE